MMFFFNDDKSKVDAEAYISNAINNLNTTLRNLINQKSDKGHKHSAADIVSGVLDVLRIPDLDASKIAFGVLDVLRIPDLSASKITSGVLGVARGGTGHTNYQALRNSLGLGNTTDALPIANGGTGATNAANARTNLGANNASNLSTGIVPRGRIESTDWTYMYGSASSESFSRWRMVAGIVFVEINYTKNAGVSTKAVSFGNIPRGYRPSRIVSAGGYLANVNDHISCMWVNTSGEVQVIAGTSSSTFYGSLSYPLG